jgi:Tfp pilus assembly protein PilP
MRTKLINGGFAAVIAIAATAVGWAQGAPAPKPAAPADATTPSMAKPATPPPTGAAQPAAPTGGAQQTGEPYTYNPEGRRDPFVSLVARGVETPTGKRVTGLSGLTTAELVVRGVLQSRGAYVALVSGPDGKTFTARTNDRLADGTIRSVTPQGIVIMQEVNDPLSLIKQKEVRKGLRTSQDGK